MKTPLMISGLIAGALLIGGTLRADPITFTTSLSGPAEAIPNISPGTGTATIIYDGTAHTLGIDLTFSGLLGLTTASHIHAPTADPFVGAASVATQTPSFSGFPLGVTSGSYSHLFDLTDLATYRAQFVTDHGGTAWGAETALIDAMLDGKAYLNIHTTVYPGGEIRGFLVRVPDGSTTLLFLIPALAGLAALSRSTRRSTTRRS